MLSFTQMPSDNLFKQPPEPFNQTQATTSSDVAQKRDIVGALAVFAFALNIALSTSNNRWKTSSKRFNNNPSHALVSELKILEIRATVWT